MPRKPWKLALSYSRSDWSFEDYPIVVRRTRARADSAIGPGWAPVEWSATIDGWLLAGAGATRDDALRELRARFAEYKARHPSLPRPGLRAPLRIAARDRVTALGPLVDEVLATIVGVNPTRCLVTDRSSLHDFARGHSVERYFERIREAYGVDVSDIAGVNLAEIVERLAAQRPSRRSPPIES